MPHGGTLHETHRTNSDSGLCPCPSAERKISRHTEKYIRAVEKTFGFLGGKDVTKAGVLEYRTFLLERLSAQTVNGYLSAVNAFSGILRLPGETA